MSEELTDDVLESRTVQQGDGCLTVTLPASAAHDLGIQAGDQILFTGQEGDDELEVQKPKNVLNRLLADD
jgi:hypothetical protein